MPIHLYKLNPHLAPKKSGKDTSPGNKSTEEKTESSQAPRRGRPRKDGS